MRRLLGQSLGLLCALGARAPGGQSTSAPSSSTPVRRALLVGVEHYPPEIHWPALAGPRADVAALRGVLLDRFGFRDGDVALLLDGAATHAGIAAGLDRLVEASAPGDLILFYFAGHGSRLPDDNPDDELDRWDETLVPYDGGLGPHRDNDIRDDEIGRWIARANRKTDQVVLIFDCCSSGTNARDETPGPSRFLSPADRGIESRSVHPTSDPAHEAEEKEGGTVSRGFDPPRAGRLTSMEPKGPENPRGSGWVRPRERYVALSACRAEESAFEVPIPGKVNGDEGAFRGLFTLNLVEELAAIREDASWSDLMLRVAARVGAKTARQSPVIEGALCGYSLFAREAPGRAPRFEAEDRVPEPLTGETRSVGDLLVRGGLLQGLSPGAVLAVCVRGSSKDDPAARLGDAEITQASAGESLARWLGTPVRGHEAGPYSAFLLENGAGPAPLAVSIEAAPETSARLGELLAATGLTRLADPAQARFEVRALGADPHPGWQIVDRTGRELWRAPQLAAGQDSQAALERLAAGLSTLGRAWRTQQILCAARTQELRADVRLELLGESDENGSRPGIGPPERDERGRWRIAPGQTWTVRVENRSEVPVYAHVVLVSPDGEVAVPCNPGPDDRILPGGVPTACSPVELEIPAGLEGFYADEPVRLFCVLTSRWHDLSSLEQDPFAPDSTARGALESYASPLAFEIWSTSMLEISVATSAR